jgi:hypothetical protein
MYDEASRLLNGPTTEAWIDPWLTYLRNRGVRWFPDTTVEGLDLQDGAIAGARVRTGGQARTVTADVFVLAIPVEAARPVLSPQIRALDPALAGLDDLMPDWMTGVQFFLSRSLPIARGHVTYVDSPWALTSISQGQFWNRDLSTYGDGRVRDIVSVGVSNWNAPGILYGKTARRATNGILDLTGWQGTRARLWRFEEPPIFALARAEDSLRYALGLPHKLADRSS